MLIAKNTNGQIVLGEHTELFPLLSCSPYGPSAAFLAENSCLPVNLFKNFDRTTQKLVSVTPYIEDGQVYTIVVEPLSTEELAQIQSTKIATLGTTLASAVNDHLNAFARTRQYDDIASAVSYRSSTVPRFATEGRQAAALRDTTWAAFDQIVQSVKAGTRPAPSAFADIESELPVLAWNE